MTFIERVVVVFILVLIEAPGRKHSGFGAHVSCQIFGITLCGCGGFCFCALANFYATRLTIKRLPMATCKMWPIWRRWMVGIGEFPFDCHGGGRGHQNLLTAPKQLLCIWCVFKLPS